MLRSVPRRHVLVAALLIVPLLALALAPGWHEGHGCRFSQDCLTCRWAADAVAETSAPIALPAPLEAVDCLASEPRARVADACPEAASSRGPPPASTTIA